MKQFVYALFICFLASFSFGKTSSVTIKWTYQNIEVGYDHENKIQVTVDGQYIGESSAFLQSSVGSFTFSSTPGKHRIQVKGFSLYEGSWEEHTIENQYAIDAIVDETYELKKQNTLSISWDLNNENTQVKFINGTVKEKKEKIVSLNVNWSFVGVETGYDHNSRMKIYQDGILIYTSPEQVQSIPGHCTAKLKSGEHMLKIIVECQYEGNWEEHLIANNYSVDAMLNQKTIFKTTNSVKLIFNLDTQLTDVEWQIK